MEVGEVAGSSLLQPLRSAERAQGLRDTGEVIAVEPSPADTPTAQHLPPKIKEYCKRERAKRL